ncbi:hypothetical protein Droror1_Dr00023318 [Drosera rotundifolia]
MATLQLITPNPNPFSSVNSPHKITHSTLSPHGFYLKPQFKRPHFIKHRARIDNGRDQLEGGYWVNEAVKKAGDVVEGSDGVSEITLFSPCKVNVFLRITRKRDDGYHDLASLFHVISLGDTIHFSTSPSRAKDWLSANVSEVPLDGRNLILKSLNLYRERTGTRKGFRINLTKKVPTGAGLGGGSSNAATALWAARQLNGAYCTGRGEVVEDIPLLIDLDSQMVLIKPPEACSTAEVYKSLRLDQTSKVDPLHLLRKISADGISQDVCINDLESPAFQVLPSLKQLKVRIIEANTGQYDAVFMSGSGSTIVGVGSQEAPRFVYDEKKYQGVFVSGATFITRAPNRWYKDPALSTTASVPDNYPASAL